MKTYTGTQTVENGFYLHSKTFSMAVMDKAGALAGTDQDTYYRVPLLLMLAAAPLLGLAFVMFLPSVGFAMTLKLVATKTLQLAGEAATDGVRVLRPSWAPALAFLTRAKPAKTDTVETKTDAWKDDVEKKLDDPNVR